MAELVKKSRDETFIERLDNGARVSMTPAIFSLGGATLYPRSMADSDCVIVMASNVAECHPVAFRWPMLAEARGLEGARRLRCGRCGGDWRAEWLRWPFCGTDEHARLRGLVGATTGETRRADGSTFGAPRGTRADPRRAQS